jgi:hypothetical protein
MPIYLQDFIFYVRHFQLGNPDRDSLRTGPDSPTE